MTTEPAEQDEVRKDRTPEQASSYWQIQLELAAKDHQDFHKSGDMVVSRYKSEKKSAVNKNRKSFNILYSNTEVLRSALYGKAAKPDVRRRFSDQDPIGRQAAEVVERGLIYCADSYDVDKPIDAAIQDYLLPGRGVVRIHYEPEFTQQPQIDPMTGQPAMGMDGQPVMQEVISDQELYESYVYWKDYLQEPARNWEGVSWVAFRHTFTREELHENKFKDAATVPLNWQPDVGKDKAPPEDLKKAEVWEIWDKSKRERVWICPGHPKALRTDSDPYGLEQFYPLPEPVTSYTTTDTAIPEPEFFAYQDQANDLDEITARISILTKAMKRRGVYDQSVKELARLAGAGDNQFIPVDNWQKLSEKGGLQASFQTEDISLIAKVLIELYKQRDMLVTAIYEVMGLGDIMRGSTDPNETLGAQELKSQFGSQRLKRRQRAVQRWIRDLYRLKAEIIAEHFEPHVLSEMTGMQIDPQVIELLRSDKLRSYRIDIETDSTVFEDAQAEKQAVTEAITGIATMLKEGLPAVQAVPELAPLVFKMLGLATRTLKGARSLEETIEQIEQQIAQKAQQPPPPDPEAQKAEMEMKMAQEEHGLEMQSKQMDMQVHQVKAQTDMQRIGLQMQAAEQKAMMPQPERRH